MEIRAFVFFGRIRPMAVFISVSIGKSASDARPIMASADPEVAATTMRALLSRVETAGAPPASGNPGSRPLQAVHSSEAR